MTSDDATTLSSSSSSLEVPYALDLSLDNQSSGLEFESPDRQRGREPLRVGDVIAYTCPVFTAGATYGRREATVVGVDPTHEHFPLVLDNCESLPWDTFVQRIGEFYRGKVRQHPGRQRPISRFVLKASGKTTNNVLAATLQQQASKYKAVLQNIETEAVRLYAGRTNNDDKSKSKLGLFPTVPRLRSKESKNVYNLSGLSRGSKSRASEKYGKGPLTDDLSTSSIHEIRNSNNRPLVNTGATNPNTTTILPSKKRHDQKSHRAVPCHVHKLDFTDSDSGSDTSSFADFRTQSPSTWLARTKIESRKEEARNTGSDSDSESNDSFLCSQKIPFYVRPKSTSKLEPAQAEVLHSRPFLSFTKQNNHKSQAETAQQVATTSGNTESALAQQSLKDHNVSETTVKASLKRDQRTVRANAMSSTQSDDTDANPHKHHDTKRRRYSQHKNIVENKFATLLESESDDSASTGQGKNPNTNTTSFGIRQLSCRKGDKLSRTGGKCVASQRHQDRTFDFHSDSSADSNQEVRKAFDRTRDRKGKGLAGNQGNVYSTFQTPQRNSNMSSTNTNPRLGKEKPLPHFSKEIESDSDTDSEEIEFRSSRVKNTALRAPFQRKVTTGSCDYMGYNTAERSKRRLAESKNDSMHLADLERRTKQTTGTTCSIPFQHGSTRMAFPRSRHIKPT